MLRFVFLVMLALVAGGAQAARAQKIIEKNVSLGSGQRVYLNLRHANSIRIRAGAGGQLALKATVNINGNRLNDALQLSQENSAGEVRFNSDLDKALLQTGQAGDCPEGGSYFGDTHVIKNGEVRGKNGEHLNKVCIAVDYDISVPANVTLRVNTISGDIDINGLTGAIEARSISGFVDVTWGAPAAELSLKTITGEVYADQAVAFSNQKDNPIVGYQLRGNLGSNGPLVKLESISNDVYFRQHK